MSEMGALARCPECGAESLEFVHDGFQTNHLCMACKRCWHVDLGYVHRVPPTTCHGCLHHDQCHSAWMLDHPQ